MKTKKKQDKLIEQIRNILNGYENDAVGGFEGGKRHIEETVKILITEQVDYYLTRR